MTDNSLRPLMEKIFDPFVQRTSDSIVSQFDDQSPVRNFIKSFRKVHDDHICLVSSFPDGEHVYNGHLQTYCNSSIVSVRHLPYFLD